MKHEILTFSLLLFSGCATLNPEASFETVKKTVEERTGHRVVWNRDTPEDAKARKHIDGLLRGKLTVDTAVEAALLNNPTLQAEYEELGVAQATLVQAGLFENPVVEVERRFRGRAAEVDIAQNLIGLFLIPLRTRVAEAELSSATNRLTQSILNHAAEVKTAFYSLQGEQQNLAMRESIVKALTASYEASRALREAGNTSILEVQNEANMLTQAKVELAQAGVRVLEEREHLNVLLGAWGDNTTWKIDDRLPDLPTEDVSLSGLETYAVTHRLDLLAAQKELESVAAQVGIARYEGLIPSLTLGGHFEREPGGASTRGPSLEFSLPLVNWGQAASAQGNALFRQALRRYEASAIEIRSKVRVAYGRMKAARTRANYFFKEVLPLQRKTREQTQLFYNGMFFGVFQLLQARQAEITAGQSYVETLKEYWLARTELEQVLGGSLKGLATTSESPVSATVSANEPDNNQSTGGGHHDHHHQHGG